MSAPASLAELEELRRFSTCAVANAIESLKLRLRNEGFTNGSIHRYTTNREPAIGFAATLKIRCSTPPTDPTPYLERTQWWDCVMSVPAPRIVVIQDTDPVPGTGALIGEVHARILQALGCTAVVTNGAVRDIRQVEQFGFSLFAGRLSVSHAYSHIVETDCAVEVGGLSVAPGDLLHGDCHGILCVPQEQTSEIARAAQRLARQEAEIIKVCQEPDFSVERLREAIRASREQQSQ